MEPTLCFSLKTGVTLVALIDLLLAIALTAASGGSLYFFEKNPEEAMQFVAQAPEELKLFINLEHLGETWIRVILIFSLVFWLQKVYLGYLLLRGGVEEKLMNCRVWLFWTLGLLSVSILFFMASVIAMVTLPWGIPVYTGMFIVRAHTIWIVARYLYSVGEGKATLLRHDGNDITTL